ncbi:coiled-coil domain-containing protein 170 isoform X2 [Clarias gariepinus]|uniref:coiled-coil domain-containing protein 170 isoform X2 n=1 Tax=Clarias gariepinus TaxID=13013 RepID=UPI00234DDC08|nr:coiled-coil domain-containing protein 170 isoform X2 [Clarias gariepinus]
MEDSVMQQHLHHYQQATESAREELAALQAKCQSLHSRLMDCQAKLSTQETTMKDLREENDRHMETEARQASLISSLRERIHNTEQEMIMISSSKTIMDMKLQALTKENEDFKERALKMENQSKEYLKEWNKTKQDATDLQRTYEDFLSRLASKLSVDLAVNIKPMETIISLVDLCCKERERQKAHICALEQSMKSHEVESKAGRETVRRLVTDVEHEQKVSAIRASDLNTVRQELDCILLKKQVLEVDNMSLRNKLQENEIALVTAREECSSYEKRSQDLEQKLHRSQNEAKALHSRMESFFKEVQVQLGNEPVTSLPKEEHVLERLREVCRKEKSSTESVTEMEARLAAVLEELGRQSELQRAAEQREQQLQNNIQMLESELLTALMSKDFQSHEKQEYLQFLEHLSEKMKIEQLTTDLGFDMRLQAILTRAEQLTRQEGAALVENKTLVYSLQKKLKEQKQRLENNDLHMDLLRKKVAQLDEEKRSRSALAVEREDALLASRKLQKKVERLQSELKTMQLSTTELKAQLSHTSELKIRVMEQDRTIEDQSKSLEKLEKNKEKVDTRLATAKIALQNQEQRARDELQQAQRLLHSQASAMAEVTQREKKLLDFCSIIAHMLGMNMPVSMPSCEVIKRLEVLIHSCHHFPLGNQCVVPYVPHHMALIPDAPVCSITIASSPGPEAPVQPPLPTTTTT